MAAGQLAQRAVGAVLVVAVGLTVRPPGSLVAGDGHRREPLRVGHLADEPRGPAERRHVEIQRHAAAVVQVVVVVELVVPTAQGEHGGGVEHVGVVDHEGLDHAVELIARADEIVDRVVVRARFVGHLPQEEAAERGRVVEMVIDFRRELVGLVRQLVGHREVGIAVVHLGVRGREIAGQLQADRVQPVRRDLVAGEASGAAGGGAARAARERILDEEGDAVAAEA